MTHNPAVDTDADRADGAPVEGEDGAAARSRSAAAHNPDGTAPHDPAAPTRGRAATSAPNGNRSDAGTPSDRQAGDGLLHRDGLQFGDGGQTGDGVPVGGRTESGTEQVDPERGAAPIRLLARVRDNEMISAFIDAADEFLDAQGYTEHGKRHAGLVGHIAYNVLRHLGHDEREAELAAVAGYLHDVGNVVTRTNHGISSAFLALGLLRDLDVPPRDIAYVMSAVGNHEEHYGESVSAIGAAVILADKSDVHRSRVRKNASIEMDIHDRVNYAVESSFLRVDPAARTITLELAIDTEISQVLEYFEIFLERMVMCRRAARTLRCDFKITVNNVPVL